MLRPKLFEYKTALITRRHMLSGGAALAASVAAHPAHAAQNSLGKQALRRLAKRLLEENTSRIAAAEMVALIDFSRPSAEARLHLVDIVSGQIDSFLTAHGRGSDPGHTGWLTSFSNEPGSKATSKGAYRTGALYEGKYGRSMRLAGLDPDNRNAEARAIVIHPAWYVGEAMIAQYGKLGRSEGCFALSDAGLDRVLARLGPGRLLFAGKLADLEA